MTKTEMSLHRTAKKYIKKRPKKGKESRGHMMSRDATGMSSYFDNDMKGRSTTMTPGK